MTNSGWDWDTAVLVSNAKSKQDNYGRQSMTLLDQALALSTPDAYNPFCGGNCSDESPFTINIVRGNTTQLYMWDFKMSNGNIYELPAGPVGMLIGTEFRKERYTDDRDPRINGTIRYLSLIHI